MRGRQDPQVTLLAFIDLETRVPSDHPLRVIKKLADQALKALSRDLDRMYANVGRPSIPPERLLKSSLLIALYSVRSERAFCEQLDYNLLFRWFLGMNLIEPRFDATTFTKNRERLLKHGVGQALFDEVVLEADRQGLLSDEHFTVDGTLIEAAASLSPNPPMDRDGRREDSGRGEGVTGAMIRARIWVDGRLAGGLQALLGAPMAAYSGCGERDGGIGHGKRRSRTGLARVCGDVGLAGGSVADGRRQAGSGMARSRARARLNCSSQGQRRGRCRVNRRAERVIRPAKAKTRRLRVLVVTIC